MPGRASISRGACVGHFLPTRLARSFERCAIEETHLDVSLENVDVPERRVFYTRDGIAVVHEFSHICSTFRHPCKPFTRNRSQLIGVPHASANLSIHNEKTHDA